MNNTDYVYNTPQEIAMRLLLIIFVSKQRISKEKLFFFDFLALHSSIVDESSKSLHPDNPQFGLEYYSKESNTEMALHLLIHKKLVDVVYDKNGYYYECNIFGKHVLAMLDGEYKAILTEQIDKVSQEFLDFPENEIQKFFDQSIVNWGAQK